MKHWLDLESIVSLIASWGTLIVIGHFKTGQGSAVQNQPVGVIYNLLFLNVFFKLFFLFF